MRLRTACLLVSGLLPLAMLSGACSSGDSAGGEWAPKVKSDASVGDAQQDGTVKKDAGDSGKAGSGGSPISTDAGDGKCTGDCKNTQTGAGTQDPFDTSKHDSSNVSVDGDGALVLDKMATASPHLIWIANSGESTVSKVDTSTYQELGRYSTGAGDPSRTSVNAIGDVYVGNRGGLSVTKVSASGQGCPDTNKDGVVTTSTGASNVLPYGQDDCVLWETPLGGDIRGMAAVDLYKQVVVDPDLPAQIEEEHYVWVGGLHGSIYKLDGATGKVLLTTTAPVPVYGFAIDGKGQLWMTNGGSLGRLDTTKCVDDASCAAMDPPCTTSCDASGNCGDTCDTAGKQAISLPDGTYGITVDFKQRVWLGGGQGLKRYNPHVPAAERYAGSVNGFSHGVAADANGWIWGAASPNVVRLNGDTMESTTVTLPSSKGMAVDKDGKIWAIGYMTTSAHVITPGPGLNDNVVTADAVNGLGQPYTYSDMTGLQAALAKNDPGHYMQTFTGCAEGNTKWVELTWDATVPKDTSVMFRVRTADTQPALVAAKWVTVATIPTAVPPVDLDAKFKAAGIKTGEFLDVEVWLSVNVSAQAVVTPKVRNFSVTYSCPPSVN
jgi:hypothetical protein